MEKNILVVDDDSYKLGHIVRALNNDFDNPNIIAASSRNDGLLKMIKCPNIDLITFHAPYLVFLIVFLSFLVSVTKTFLR